MRNDHKQCKGILSFLSNETLLQMAQIKKIIAS